MLIALLLCTHFAVFTTKNVQSLTLPSDDPRFDVLLYKRSLYLLKCARRHLCVLITISCHFWKAN